MVDSASFDPASFQAIEKAINGLQSRNCASTYIQLSSEVFPENKEVQRKSELPLCAIIRPFAQLDNPQVSHFGSHQIIRCDSCRAYINIFSLVSDDSRSFTCNLCEMTQSLPEFYRSM